jgi:hypothetical protein
MARVEAAGHPPQVVERQEQMLAMVVELRLDKMLPLIAVAVEEAPVAHMLAVLVVVE